MELKSIACGSGEGITQPGKLEMASVLGDSKDGVAAGEEGMGEGNIFLC